MDNLFSQINFKKSRSINLRIFKFIDGLFCLTEFPKR